MKRCAIVGAAVVVAALLGAAVPAGAGVTPVPYPVLRVAKTIDQATQQGKGQKIAVPPDTVFTIRVTCGLFVTDLRFDAHGKPKSTSDPVWQDLGDGVWTAQDSQLANSRCTAEEVAITDGKGNPTSANVEVQYKCEASASTASAGAASGAPKGSRISTFRCVAPGPPFGQYYPAPPFGSATNAAVEFTAADDPTACERALAELDSEFPCLERATLTVDNLDPAWIGDRDDDDGRDHAGEPPPAVPVVSAPRFTG
jgi:hypothetical protein